MRDTVPTGFPSLDRMLGGGFRRQDLIVLAGDVGSGKSALALAMAIRSAGGGVPTVYLSGEMNPARVFERAVAMEVKATVDDLRQDRVEAATRDAARTVEARLRACPLVIRELLGASFAEVRAGLDAEPGAALVVVDSLQLTPPPRPAGWRSGSRSRSGR